MIMAIDPGIKIIGICTLKKGEVKKAYHINHRLDEVAEQIARQI